PSNGIPATVTLLLNAGTDPSAATTQEVPGRYSAAGLAVGTTPLHLAARNGDTPVMRALLNARADVQLADGNGDTALHFAARTWQTNALTLLLNARAPLEVTNRNSHTPLRTAVESSVTPAVATLLDAGANHTNGLGGNTLLHIAVTRNDRNTTTLLLKRKFALESRDATGNTPLQAAALAHSVDMVKFLRDQGADFNATNFTGNSVLHLLAAQQDDTVYHAPDESAFAEWERKQFATGSWVSRGLAALMKAKLLDPLPPQGWTNYSLSKWLIDHGTIANVTNRAGQNPLHIVCSADWIRWYYGNQHSNRVAALLNAGVRLDQPDTNGMTPLHLVATNSWQQGQIFKLLLAKAGPTLVNQPDARGHTLLHRAVEGARDNFEGVTALLAIGANVNAQDTNGATALHVLVSLPQDGWMYRRREMAMMLLTNKANPNLTDKQGRTPLFIAMSRLSNYNEWNQRELITTLLTNGANPNLADRDGNTAVHAYLLATNSSSRFSFRDPMHSALKARADFSLTNRLGVTPLQLLAETKSPYSHPLHMLTDFLDLTNAAFTVRGPDGNTPLHQFAARSPNCPQCGDVLGKLLAVEGRSSLTNFSGQTPLDILSATNSRSWLASRVFAASSNNPKALASTDASGQPLLHRMMQSLPLNNYDTQQFFRRALTNKSLINLTNTDGDTPLHIALRQRDSFFARQLVEAGADRKLANAKGETPVRLAAINFPFGPTILNPPDTRLPFFGAVRSRGNNNDFDRWLDFDPGLATITNRDGVTPLMAASEARNTHVVEKLLALGVPIDALSALRLGRLEDFRSLLTQVKLPLPAHWMFEAVRFDRLEGLQILATNGCNVKAVDADGHSLLFHARAANQPTTIDWLVTQGCRETLFDFIANNDRTATAAMLDADKSLLEKLNDRGRLPIVTAVATGKSEIVADLIKR
ncbi:MAG: serine/threonine-protein phosphatase 6 regulatory ankyrin repeat subunit, partial [Verrucomicrobiota bacterium]